jgi:broad specificity phosphatase PhoE/RimJ/RimL family protein N-acetyltransferase
VTTVYLVQHGEKQRLPGDPGLTEVGRQQAATVAEWLGGRGLRALYTSPLRRARQTADAISVATGLTATVDDRLRERLNWDGIQPFESFLTDWNRSAQDRDFVPAHGESARSAGARMQAFLLSLADQPGPVAAVTHGGATIELLRTLLGDDQLTPGLLQDGIPACAVTTLEGLDVVAIASVEHLGCCDRMDAPTAPGLLLRPWTEQDIPALLAAHRDPLMRQWLTHPITNASAASRFIQARRADRESVRAFSFAILETDAAGAAGPVSGGVSLRSPDPESASADVGYWVAPAARGHGLASRALDAVCRWSFRLPRATPLQRLQLIHAVGNEASCRVAAKTQFALAAILPPQPPDYPSYGHLHIRTR